MKDNQGMDSMSRRRFITRIPSLAATVAAGGPVASCARDVKDFAAAGGEDAPAQIMEQ